MIGQNLRVQKVMSQRSTGSCTRCTRANAFPDLNPRSFGFLRLSCAPSYEEFKENFTLLLALLTNHDTAQQSTLSSSTAIGWNICNTIFLNHVDVNLKPRVLIKSAAILLYLSPSTPLLTTFQLIINTSNWSSCRCYSC